MSEPQTPFWDRAWLAQAIRQNPLAIEISNIGALEPGLTIPELAERIGKPLHRVRRALRSLPPNGHVSATRAANRTIVHLPLPRLYAPAYAAFRIPRLRPILCLLFAWGRTTRPPPRVHDFRAFTRVSDSAVRQTLYILVESGCATRHDHHRWETTKAATIFLEWLLTQADSPNEPDPMHYHRSPDQRPLPCGKHGCSLPDRHAIPRPFHRDARLLLTTIRSFGLTTDDTTS